MAEIISAWSEVEICAAKADEADVNWKSESAKFRETGQGQTTATLEEAVEAQDSWEIALENWQSACSNVEAA